MTNNIQTFEYKIPPQELINNGSGFVIDVDYVVSNITGKQTLLQVTMLPALMAMIKDMRATYENIAKEAKKHALQAA